MPGTRPESHHHLVRTPHRRQNQSQAPLRARKHQAADGTADNAVDGAVDGAFLQTPPFPVLVAALPPGGAAELVATFTAERGLPRAANVAGLDEATFLAAWSDVTGGTASVRQRSRLFRLGELTPPDPVPAGAARAATVADRELVLAWLVAFHAEATPESPASAVRTAGDRLSRGGFTLWEVGGKPVALAGRTPEVAGVARIAPVYTPPEHRRRSYGGGVTTAATQAALDEGAEAVVLFTDQANPTSNALYQRLGYRPVEDRVVLDLQPGPADQRVVTSTDGTSSERPWRIAIAGGTGTLGSLTGAELTRRGHEVRVLSRRSPEYPVDLTSGDGLAKALDGCAAVVDASNASSPKRAAQVLAGGSRRLLAAEQRAGIGHHVCISIVGCERVPVGYYRVKTEQEQVVRSGPVPWSIVRATQFHELAAHALGTAGKYHVLPVPRMTLQPVAAADVARLVADVTESGPRGRVQITGPQILTVRELAAAWRSLTGTRAVLLPVLLPGKVGRALRDGALTSADADERGTVRFADWLAARQHQ